jgi:hypothetical protein
LLKLGGISSSATAHSAMGAMLRVEKLAQI